MAATRPLARPPIREAIIEVKSELCEFGNVNRFRDRIASQFPICKPFRMASMAYQIPEGTHGADADESSIHQIGWRCESADGREVALVRTDGFSVARLAGYPGWEGFVDRFLSLWTEYQSCVAPVEINRVGLRYINDVRLPITESFDVDQYLTTAPKTPAGLPQAFVDFLVQMTIPGGTDRTLVNVTQATDSNARTETELPVIIDIDVCSDRIYPAEPGLASRVATTLSDMRHIKNRVFFGLITETLAESYG